MALSPEDRSLPDGKSGKTALLAAGGTGGHLFPAQALGTVLKARGWSVHLVTDHRVDTIAQDFPADAAHVVPSATFGLRNPIKAASALMTLGRGYLKSRRLLADVEPDIVVGFGGYPTLPPLFAAAHRRTPTLIHDQNAVMGRANRLLSGYVTGIGTAFPKVRLLDDRHASKATAVGVPVRQAVLEAADIPYAPPASQGAFKILVFGGSQGAAIMKEVVPAALAGLDPTPRARLQVTQQGWADDLPAVEAVYRNADIAHETAAFFTDLPQRIAGTHLIISRSGASTVAELGVIGRPAVLVPLPGALDQDQLYNARAIEAANGAIVLEQPSFTPERLRALILQLMSEPQRLTAMAGSAKLFGTPDAAHRLFDRFGEPGHGRGGRDARCGAG